MKDRGEVIRSTGAHMTRFFFSVDEAADLVVKSLAETENRAIFSYPMKSCKIERLLNAFCENYGCKSEIIAPRPGERDYEVLIGESELDYSEKLKNGLFMIRSEKSPHIYSDDRYLYEPYTTDNCDQLSDAELLEYVKNRPC
jgi:FlaA1/EpsC-like NDP-sugar epimerase